VDSSVSDTPQGRFPKSAHLLKHSDFQRVYQQGHRHFSGIMTVFYLRTGDLPMEAGVPGGKASDGEDAVGSRRADAASAPSRRIRVGFTVPKTMGGAVERNRMRRRTREAVRHQLSLLKDMSGGVDIVINPKKSLFEAEFVQISREIERAFTVVRRAYTSGSEAESKRSGANKTPRSGANKTPRGGADKSKRSGADKMPRSGANKTPPTGADRTRRSEGGAMSSTKQEARPQ
jgi:ribonuclease P protein component